MRGKREARRNYLPFAAGMLTMVLLIGLISASLASEKPGAGSGAEPAEVGVGLFMRQQIAPGEMLTTESGGKAPKVLAYADSKGETHYYLEAGAAAELFDVTCGVSFNEEANRLEFGSQKDKDLDADGKITEVWDDVFSARDRTDFLLGASTDASGQRIIIGGDVPVIDENGMVTAIKPGLDAQDPEQQKEIWARHRSILLNEPEYGKTLGMYTEVDPAEVNLATLSGVDLKERVFQDSQEVERLICFTTKLGKYAVITLENTGKADAEVWLARLDTVGGGGEAFSGVLLPAGGKLVRAFRIDGDKPLENQLQLRVSPLAEGGVEIKLSTEQYRSGT
ncbi:MAG: hypothetical protein HFG00_00630 [Oscillibacter sp.]|nr:hypothetical protein [Oscillibacter sp.]